MNIDLNTEQIEIGEIKALDEQQYIGGMGVATAYFIREVAPEIRPFEEGNLLIFAVGPFCGTSVPFCGRHFVISKSPLTGILGESSAGGFFGKELKATGFDYVVVRGKSVKPVYLSIMDGTVSIHSAEDLWGKGTQDGDALLKKMVNDEKAKVAIIGPAGEKLVKYAGIISDSNHAAGRCGLGTVMGDKKLKAIVVRGSAKPPVQDSEALATAVKKIQNLAKESLFASLMATSGTPLHFDTMAINGDIVIKNWLLPRWGGVNKLGANAIKNRGDAKRVACFNCPIACRQLIEYEGNWVSRPEYETLAMLGSNLLVDDLETLIKWNLLVNDLGVDSISLGGCIAMFLESAERNLLDVDLDKLGFVLNPETQEWEIWGSKPGIEKLIQLIAYREGIGNELAEGVRQFCKSKNLPEDLAIHVKGFEVPAHEPRASNMTALDYATSPRGAYHCYEPMQVSFNMNLKVELGIDKIVDRFGAEEPVEVVKKIQDAGEAYSACGGCIFGFWFIHEITPWIEALNAITGRSYTIESWMAAGERIFNLKRAYNIDCGITKSEDSLNSRFFTPFTKGGARKRVPPLEEMLAKYYKLRGWDVNGRPPA